MPTLKSTRVNSKTKVNKVRVLFPDHIKSAAEMYLRSLSVLDDDEYVVDWRRVPEGIEITIEKD